MPRVARKEWDSRPPARSCSAARRFWCWMRSGRWCSCDDGEDGEGGEPSFSVLSVSARMIQLEALTKSFGPKRALDGATLEVPDGENAGIMGSSGVGRSVTLKCLGGL